MNYQPLLVGVVGFALACGLEHAAARADTEVGQVIAELRLPTIERDRTVSLHGLRGRKLLLIEFASW